MPQGKPRDPGKEQRWRQLIDQWHRSGLTVRDFCQRQHLATPSFYAWRRTLTKRHAQAVGFVPVEVLAESPVPGVADGSAAGLELVLGTGRRLRVGPGFDEATLQRLLAVLEAGQP